MAQIWIEAALNGPWGRERQPGIPITVEEVVADGLAAAAEGAAIVHVHAYDPRTGRQNDAWETYADPFRERGVLRRNVPHWLRAPELRGIVLGFEEAARHHGGGGALYIRLRRR